MTEPTKQVPVSLIEEAIAALVQPAGGMQRRKAGVALRSLLSQPTPTAEPEWYSGRPGFDDSVIDPPKE